MANHLGESIAGAVTIRAFKQEDRFFAKSLDLTTIMQAHLFTALLQLNG